MAIFFHILLSNLLSAMAYRAAFLTESFLMMVNNGLFVITWYFFFERFGTIGGLDFGTYVFFQAFMSLAFWIHHVFLMGSWDISAKIRNGTLDGELLLPKDPLARILVGRTNFSAFGDIIFGVLLFFLLYSEPSIGGFFIFLTTAILSAGILVAIVVGVQSLAFFVGDTEELSGGFFHLVLAPSTYPPDIFTNSAIRFIFYSIVPVFFTTWLPFELIRSFNWIGLWILTVFTAFISGASYAIFRLGLKRYESGNLMNVRI